LLLFTNTNESPVDAPCLSQMMPAVAPRAARSEAHAERMLSPPSASFLPARSFRSVCLSDICLPFFLLSSACPSVLPPSLSVCSFCLFCLLLPERFSRLAALLLPCPVFHTTIMSYAMLSPLFFLLSAFFYDAICVIPSITILYSVACPACLIYCWLVLCCL